uniref:Uncharacterized protein n=1 Tax=Arundo donax TaxID=35708 RepID=A0A0A9AXV8_ARUDO
MQREKKTPHGCCKLLTLLNLAVHIIYLLVKYVVKIVLESIDD